MTPSNVFFFFQKEGEKMNRKCLEFVKCRWNFRKYAYFKVCTFWRTACLNHFFFGFSLPLTLTKSFLYRHRNFSITRNLIPNNLFYRHWSLADDDNVNTLALHKNKHCETGLLAVLIENCLWCDFYGSEHRVFMLNTLWRAVPRTTLFPPFSRLPIKYSSDWNRSPPKCARKVFSPYGVDFTYASRITVLFQMGMLCVCVCAAKIFAYCDKFRQFPLNIWCEYICTYSSTIPTGI